MEEISSSHDYFLVHFHSDREEDSAYGRQRNLTHLCFITCTLLTETYAV